MENNSLLNDARQYLIEFLKGKQHRFETKHPWRKEWEFAVSHSLRVERYVVKILERESHQLSKTEITLLRLAAILHDIGRLEITDDHARLGAAIAKEWLSENRSHELNDVQIEHVVEMIVQHSDKDGVENNFSKAVLKDADTLDEIGAMSIFMSSNWIDRKSPFFFQELLQRLKDFEIPFCEDKETKLNTKGAREILEEKKAFIEGFIIQLENELEADAQLEQFLKNSRANGS